MLRALTGPDDASLEKCVINDAPIKEQGLQILDTAHPATPAIF